MILRLVRSKSFDSPVITVTVINFCYLYYDMPSAGSRGWHGPCLGLPVARAGRARALSSRVRRNEPPAAAARHWPAELSDLNLNRDGSPLAAAAAGHQTAAKGYAGTGIRGLPPGPRGRVRPVGQPVVQVDSVRVSEY